MTTREVSYNLAGSVRNMGLPVAGTTIVLYDYWSTGTGLQRHFVTEQTTGPRGEFGFDVRKGVYTLEVIPNRDTRFARQSIGTVKVTGNTTVSIGLKHGSVYSGRVCTASGDIVGNCELLVIGIEPESLTTIEPVGEDGKFSISLPKGKYYIALSQKAPAKKRANAFISPGLKVVDLYGDLQEDITLPELVNFKGAVTNPDGHPVSDVKVTIRSSTAQDMVAATEIDLKAVCYTNKIGQFQCEVEPGTYDVLLEPGPDSHLSERKVSSILVDQARTRAYSLGPGHRLQGQVTFEGEPVENALVSVFGGKIDSYVLTDDDGWYSFSLSGGTYELSVVSQPDSLAKLPFRLLAPYTCSINLAEDTVRNVELEQGVSISGKVTDNAGKPRAGIQLALYADRGRPVDTTNGADRPVAFGITGDDGSYEFRVSQGRYLLITNNQICTTQSLEPAEEDLTRDVTWQSGCVVTFKVVSESDEPIANCKVSCEPYETHGAGPNTAIAEEGAVSSEDGSCTVNLAAGIYTFHFEPPEHGSYQSRQIRQLSINSDIHRKVKLALKAVPVQQ